ncbi:hypothetical protein EJ04DRAFT_570693 [Polyplosphaeria fusca]|uniref:Uncharacterized protein n=1 Tax=Polyplosphaeria fusca TaxID=682080 RepID=A0A9P4QII1_9PLEO|nr:hypothetical protein EJ04DRAFT_570693 [Polyplosphaeria fusca]
MKLQHELIRRISQSQREASFHSQHLASTPCTSPPGPKSSGLSTSQSPKQIDTTETWIGKLFGWIKSTSVAKVCTQMEQPVKLKWHSMYGEDSAGAFKSFVKVASITNPGAEKSSLTTNAGPVTRSRKRHYLVGLREDILAEARLASRQLLLTAGRDSILCDGQSEGITFNHSKYNGGSGGSTGLTNGAHLDSKEVPVLLHLHPKTGRRMKFAPPPETPPKPHATSKPISKPSPPRIPPESIDDHEFFLNIEGESIATIEIDQSKRTSSLDESLGHLVRPGLMGYGPLNPFNWVPKG